MRFGITGHQRLENATQWGWVRDQIGRIFTEMASPGDIALTSLAVGADTVFAEVALEHQLRISVVVPCQRYAETFRSRDDVAQYARLRALANTERVLDYAAPSEEAFDRAGQVIVEECDLLVAVWNGKPAAGRGGTGDVVEWARGRGREMVWLDPVNSRLRS